MTVIEQVPLERISAEAREVHVGRLILTILAGLFYGVGWIAARISLAIVWSAVAIRVGWQEGRRPREELRQRN